MKRILLLGLLAGATPGLALAQDIDTRRDMDTRNTLFGPVAGNQEFSISGSGTSGQDFDRTDLSLSGEWGWYFTDRTLFGVRQGVSFADRVDGSDWYASTRGYTNHHFGQEAWRPFVGASVGINYGDEIDETGFAGLETGLKYYVQPETFITGRVEWQWFFDEATEAEDTFEDGAFVYNVGVGYNF